MGVGQTYPLVLPLRVITGVGAVLLNAILGKMAADWFAGKEIVTATGVILISCLVGIALGLVLQSAVADVYPWPAQHAVVGTVV